MTLTTSPGEIQQGSTATLAWDVDFAAHLAGVEALSAPTCTLERTDGTFHAAGVGSVAVVGTVVRVTLTALEKGATYRMVTRATIAADKVPTAETRVVVPH